jgi:hypothetical protein
MFTFSIVGSSIGYATPIDAEIETVFKSDVEKVAVESDVLTFSEIEKVAEVGIGCIETTPEIRVTKGAVTIWQSDHNFNYNYFKHSKTHPKRLDLPLLVPLV